MIPDFASFKRLSKKGNLIALSKSIPADLETPVSAFLKIAAKETHAFLLESAEQEEHIGRYSIMGIRPEKILSGGSHLADKIEGRLASYELANPENLPGFSGGFVGFLSYENVIDFESIKLVPKKSPSMPQGIFFLVQEFLVFDHFRKSLSVVILLDTPKKGSLLKVYKRAHLRIGYYIKKLQSPLKSIKSKEKSRLVSPKSNMNRQAFERKVRRIKEYIRAGDAIQVVLSQRFKLPAVADDFQIYRALRSINPSPYMFYFRSGNFRLVGSSPEMLVRKTGSRAEVRPIAGTRPRGKDETADLAMEENLKRSTKEMAEHLMLVDLGRNDLGRVCEFESVRVENFAHIERYSHVMHLVSDVVGKLKRGKTAFDLLKATFPAGTVTGAPKIRAMQIINELETENRGPYAGCLGYFGFNQDMDMCITIRTLVCDGKHIYLQAGAGIVKDSSPQREYEETLNKARALLKAIERRGEF